MAKDAIKWGSDDQPVEASRQDVAIKWGADDRPAAQRDLPEGVTPSAGRDTGPMRLDDMRSPGRTSTGTQDPVGTGDDLSRPYIGYAGPTGAARVDRPVTLAMGDDKRTRYRGRVLDADIPEMSPATVARDIAAGALQIGPTAVKGVGDIARLATGDSVGKGLSDFAERGNKAIQEVVGSERSQMQRKRFEQDMADSALNAGDVIVGNPGALADQVLPTVGSMFLPVGVAGAAGKAATATAKGLDAAQLLARANAAREAAAIGATVVQNASDTYSTIRDAGGAQDQAYLGAAITAPATYVAGRLTGGGAEANMAKILSGQPGSAAVKGLAGVGKAMGKEGAQEVGEEVGQYVGETTGKGDAFDANAASKRLAVAGTLGGVVGGMVDATGRIPSGQKERIARMREAGDTQAADVLQGQVDREEAAQSAESELQTLATADPQNASHPVYQDAYRTLRTDGIKPAEASARAAMTAGFMDLTEHSGAKDSVALKAVEMAKEMPISKVPGFFQKLFRSLSARGIGEEITGVDAVIEGLRDTAMQAAAENLYGDTASLTQDIASLEGAQPVKEDAQTGKSAQAVDNISNILSPSFDNGNDPVITPEADAVHQAATSPLNDLPEPTDAQKQAGNYKMGRLRVAGLDISIENPQGSTRRGVDAEGNPWESPMRHHYGYFRKTDANDGDKLDVFVKPGTPEDFKGPVFVVDQVDPKTGKLDEHKVILGASDEDEAESIYRSNYTADWNGLGAITRLPLPAFKAWAKSGAKNEPLGDINVRNTGDIQSAPSGGDRRGGDQPSFSVPAGMGNPDDTGIAVDTGSAGNPPEGGAFSQVPAGDASGLLDSVAPEQSQDSLGEPEEHPAEQQAIAGLRVIEAPVDELKLSNDVPQFKSDANADGVVEPLGGKFDRTGVAPIQVWKRLNGDLEVISGRHRLDLARRSGEATIPVQIHNEADGFDSDRASSLDSELNIRDGQGKVRDFIKYFQSNGFDKAEADNRGLLARATGQRAFTIANEGDESLIAAHRAGQLTDEGAVAIARAAPNDGRLQAVGLRAIADGRSISQAVNMVHAVNAMALERPDNTGDMFGFDDSAMKEAELMAKVATAKQRSLGDRLAAMTGAAKRPELAKSEGINVKNPAAVLKRAKELQTERAAWENWSTSPELIAQIRAEMPAGSVSKPVDAIDVTPEPVESAVQNEPDPPDTSTASMFDEEPAPEPAFSSVLRPSGALAITGDPQAIRNTLTAAGVKPAAIKPTPSGVVVGNSQVAAAQAAIAPKPTPQSDLLGDAPNASQQEAARILAKKKEREQGQQNAAPAPAGFDLGMVDSRNGNEVAPGQREIDSQKAPAKIEDFGEKIGGARKDTAVSTGAKRKASEQLDDARPTWAKRFQVSQVAGGFDVSVSGQDITGQWVISDLRNKDRFDQPKQVGKYFDSKESAEAALPLLAVVQKHRVLSGERAADGTYKQEIWREINDRKRVKVVDQEFSTREEAMRYMVQHAQEILETNTTFGEADIPKPESTARKGMERRTGDVTGDQFIEAFGFRGVEFGNWNNQEERQEVMNAAYDGLMDLAEVLGIPPKAIGLNGDLALAFGARGHGLTGARAHYERNRAVMNLTKMNGAGALAHEWFHALDNYLARQDGKASSEWKVNADGTRSLVVSGADDDMASGGFRRVNSGVREELRNAYTALVQSLFTKAEQYVEDTARADKFVAVARGELEKDLASIRTDLSEQKDIRYYKRNNKPASAEQLAAFDAIAAELVEGRGLETEWKTFPGKSRLSIQTRHTNDALEKLGEIYKAVRGRSGFNSERHGTLDSLTGYMRRYEQRLKMLSEANALTTKTKRVPTSFAMDAKSLDQGRGGDYWTSPHEMVARAFQGYVEDAIAAKGGQSPFLNYAPENAGILTPWGVKRPFPSGEERKAMNAEFDKFVSTLQTKETDSGVAMFSRDGDLLTDYTPEDAKQKQQREADALKQEQLDAARKPAPGKKVTADQVDLFNEQGSLFARRMSDEAFRKAFGPTSNLSTREAETITADLSRTWTNGPVVKVVADYTQLPVEAPADAKGLYWKGTAFIVANRHTGRDQIARTLAHEAIAHHGLREMLGPEGFKSVMRNIQLARVSGNTAIKAISEKVRKNYVDANGAFNLTPGQEADEIAAAVAEQSVDPVTGELRVGFGFMKAAWSRIAEFLRSIGLDVKFTMPELHGMLVRSIKNMEAGEKMGGISKTAAPVFHATSRSGAPTLSREIREEGFPRGIGAVISTLPRPYVASNLKNHPDYLAAKSGDRDAAVRYVNDMVKPENIAEAKRMFGKDVIFVGAKAQEASGLNRIPDTMAMHYANELGARWDSGIVQTNKAFHTGAGRLERLVSRPLFDGPVRSGESYVLVDDVLTMGGTLAELADHIRAHGGKIAGVIVLSDASKTGRLSPSAQTVNQLERRFGNEIRSEFHVEPAALTADEALTLNGLRDVDDLRNSASQARQGRARRLAPEALPAGTDSVTTQPDGAQFSRTPEDQETWLAPEDSRLDRVIYELQDGRIDLKRVQQAITKAGGKISENFDTRLAETLYPGRVATRSKTFLDDEAKPLLESMARNNVSMNELSDYLHARGAEERNAQIAKVNPDLQDGGSGTNTQGVLMTNDAARDYLAGISQTRNGVLNMLAKKVDAITAGTRGLLVGEGLEKPEVVAKWKEAYKNYVPMFRDEAEAGAPHPTGNGMSVRGSASKRATGSTKNVTNILAHVLMQREAAITRAEKNRVALSLYGLALSNPNREFWTTIKPNMSQQKIVEELARMGVDPTMAGVGMEGVPTIRTVDPITNTVMDRPNPLYKSLPGAIVMKINGEDRVLMLNQNDPRALRMAENLKNLDGLTKMDIAGSVIGRTTRWLAAINTQYSPAFGLINVTRDVLGASVNIGSTALRGKAMKVLANTPAAGKGIARELSGAKSGEWGKLYRQFQADGGQTGYRDMWRDPNERTNAIGEELAGLENSGKLTPGNAARLLVGLIDGFNTTLENAVRLSAYKAALDQGMSRAQAARLGRELTVDFNRKGRAGREIGPLYAFFNASVQGTARTIETLKGPTGMKVIAGGLALGMIQALALAMAGYDDDEIAEFNKARALIIPTPWGKKKEYIAIPLPLGLHVLPTIGRVVTELGLSGGRDTGKRAVDALGEIIGAFNPLGGGNVFTKDGALRTLAPTLVDPLVEMVTNKNFAGIPIEREGKESDNRPGAARARERTLRQATGQVYLGISKAINTMTGGNEFEAGALSPTPEMVRYVAQTVGGGALRELEKAVNSSIAKAQGDEVKRTQVPMVGRFYGEVDDEQVQQRRYYDTIRKLEKAQSSIRAAENAGNDVVAAQIERDTPQIALGDDVRRAKKDLAEVKKEISETIGDRKTLRKLDQERIEIMREVNTEVRRLDRMRNGPTWAQRISGVPP